jgi:hypothetical protein
MENKVHISPASSVGAAGGKAAFLQNVTCFLAGGPHQHAATAVACDLAGGGRTRVTGVAASPPHWSAFLDISQRHTRVGVEQPLSQAALSAVADYEAQYGERLGETSHIAKGTWSYLSRVIGGQSLAVVPAEVGLDGSFELFDEEVAALVQSLGSVPVLRVRRRPLRVSSVLLLIDNTALSRKLSTLYQELGLWAEARVVILPMDRPSVPAIVQEQVHSLRAHGHDVAVMQPLDLNFERSDLERLLPQFHVAVMGHLSYRIGPFFDLVRNNAFEIVAKQVPMTLLPDAR